MQQLTLFDYNTLDIEARIIVQQRTSEIKGLMKRAAQDIIEIGQKLIEVKGRLGHGSFRLWLASEFDWTPMTANNFMNVADKCKNFLHLDNFGPSALYLLAAPSTPETARQEALERTAQGETIPYSTAKEIVTGHKEAIQPLKLPTYNYACEDCQERFNTPVWHCPECDHHYSEDGNECGNCHFIRYPDPVDYPVANALEWDTYQTETTTPILNLVDTNTGEILISKPVQQPQSMALLTSSKNDSWRTPLRYIEAARQVMGGIDLDVATSEVANESIQALDYFTKDDDALNHHWYGRVWLNPPYGKTDGKSNQGLFAAKLVEEYEAGRVTQGILLVNLYVGYEWFRPLRNRPRCEPDHRITFINPETNEEGDEAKASSVFIYFGKDPLTFYEVFSQFGECGQLARFN